jgi:hypothetical protein
MLLLSAINLQSAVFYLFILHFTLDRARITQTTSSAIAYSASPI